MMNESAFVESRNLREKYMSRIDVLDKVKELFLIPGLEMMTGKQAAEFFEVAYGAFRQCYLRNKAEIDNDGAVKMKGVEALRQNVAVVGGCKGNQIIQIRNKEKVLIPSAYSTYFPKRAILRIAMLLRDSEVAKEIRTQLLNAFEHTDEAQRTADLDEERQLCLNVGLALSAGDWASYQLASAELLAFKNRHIAEAKEAIADLEKKNSKLKAVNGILARETVEIREPRKLLIYLVNLYSRVRWPGMIKNIRIRRAYRDVYGVLLNNEPHIDLYSRQMRRGEAKLIDCIDSDEYGFAIKAVMGLILNYNGGAVPSELDSQMERIQSYVDSVPGALNIG